MTSCCCRYRTITGNLWEQCPFNPPLAGLLDHNGGEKRARGFLDVAKAVGLDRYLESEIACMEMPAIRRLFPVLADGS
jgi:hypothetical protein